MEPKPFKIDDFLKLTPKDYVSLRRATGNDYFGIATGSLSKKVETALEQLYKHEIQSDKVEKLVEFEIGVMQIILPKLSREKLEEFIWAQSSNDLLDEEIERLTKARKLNSESVLELYQRLRQNELEEVKGGMPPPYLR